MSEFIKTDWCNADTRKQLILRLKDCVKDLMPYVHQKETSHLNENIKEVAKLCETLEIIFFHGIKIKEFQGQIPFWGLLERLEIANPPSMAIRNSVGAVACVPILRTPLGKARGWIRQSLNMHTLEESIQFMQTNINTWLVKFYSSDSLLCQKDDVNLLIAVIRSMKIISFNCQLEDNSLNMTTPVINKIVQTQLSTNTPVVSVKSPPASAKFSSSPQVTESPRRQNQPPVVNNNQEELRQPNVSSNSSSFDSIVKSFEFGFDKLMHSVDAFLSSNSIHDPNIASPAEDLYSSRKMIPLFGSSLKDLLLDERRCQYAFLNPELGIPTQILKLINYIHHFIQTPNLFRQKISIHSINELKKSLETEQGIPTTSNIATVCFVFIQWLNQLPEPLLGFDHYSAILACSELEDIHHRTRNLSLLILEAPWYNKPLLLAVVSLLSKCLLPENVSHNNLNHIAVSVLCTPFLLRPPYEKPFFALTQEEIDKNHMSATAAGSHIIEFIMNHYELVFQPFKEDLTMKQIILTNKCLRIRSLQEALSVPFDINEVNSFDNERLQLIYHLWNLLLNAEKNLSFNNKSHAETSQETTEEATVSAEKQETGTNVGPNSSLNMKELLQSERWEVCGIKTTTDADQLPLTEFNVALGWLALKSFVTFIKKYVLTLYVL
jgi:hypothetical protein